MKKLFFMVMYILVLPCLSYAEIQVGTGGLVFSDATTQTTAAGSSGFGDWEVVTATGVAATDTAAIQTALDTGHPVYLKAGTFYLNARLTMSTYGQTLMGAGLSTILYAVNTHADIGWTRAANKGDSTKKGIIVITGDSVTIRDLHIKTQMDTSAWPRSSWIKFPPALHFYLAERSKVLNVRISLVNYGIFYNDNCGGSFIDNLEMSFIEHGITTYAWEATSTHGCLDTMRFSNIHFWAFDNSGNLMTLMYGNDLSDRMPDSADSCVTCIYAEGIDDLRLFNCLSMASLFLYANDSYGSIVECAAERCFFKSVISNFEVTNSRVEIGQTGSYYQVLEQYMGRTLMTGCYIAYAPSDSNPPSSVMQIEHGGDFTMTGCRVIYSKYSQPFVYAFDYAQVALTGNEFSVINNHSGSVYMITIAGTGTKLVMTGNMFHYHSSTYTSYGTALSSAYLVSLDTDNYHIVVGNSFFGGSVTYPSLSSSVWAHNS